MKIDSSNRMIFFYKNFKFIPKNIMKYVISSFSFLNIIFGQFEKVILFCSIMKRLKRAQLISTEKEIERKES